ncbi:MAG: NapC/NirT family cytochrome c [Candidatus Rokuibacteriota bacterium]
MTFPSIAAAAEAAAIADHEAVRWGTALDWAIALSVVVSAAILVLIIASRVLYRGQQAEGTALWFHGIALAVLPLFLLATGQFATLEYATEVRFCGTCHLTMKPYIDDLHNAKSESLAALHFQHRVMVGTECYSCHANYGIHGTFEAKLTGLRHVWKYNTGTYKLPIKMPAPFGNELCLKCHNGAKSFMAQDVHLEAGKVSADLRDSKQQCVDCHSPAHDLGKPGDKGKGKPDDKKKASAPGERS